MDGDLVHCNIIQELMKELQLENTSRQWRLLVHSCKVNLKRVLLHNENRFPFSQWLVQFTLNKPKKTFRFCCKKIRYKEHWWHICAELNVIAMLTGLQGGYTSIWSTERGTPTTE
jgi:hypothetical protein